MTRTRAQRAAEEAASKTNGADRQENVVVLPKNLATSTHKIQKSKNVIQINCAPPNPPQQQKQSQSSQQKAANTKKQPVKPVVVKAAEKKGKGKGKSPAGKQAPKEITYNEELVNLKFIKKYDQDAVADQTGNSNGDSHLPRATLNHIVREILLPLDVRAQKETMDLICFISNAFVDLLSDVSNNVCYEQNKKNIMPEHTIRALQELHLDDYLPYLLTDNQNLSLKEILSQEKKRQGGLQATQKQIINEDRDPKVRETIVSQMLKRLTSESQNKKDYRINHNWGKKNPNFQGMTEAEIIAYQQEILGQEGGQPPSGEEAESELDDQVAEDTNLQPEHVSGEMQQTNEDYDQYWQDYKNNWIIHNKATLDVEYENWVKSYIEYNTSHVQANPDQAAEFITDENLFRQTWTADYFYNVEYDKYIQQMYPPQHQEQNPNSTIPTQEPTDQQQIDSSAKPQPNNLANMELEDTNFNLPEAVKQPSFKHQVTMADIAPATTQLLKQQSTKKLNEDELDFDDMDE